MTKYAFIRGRDAKEIIVLNMDTFISCYIKVDKIPVDNNIKYFDFKNISYSGDKASIVDCHSTIAFINKRLGFYVALKPIQNSNNPDTLLLPVIVPFEHYEKYKEKWKIGNTELHELLDIEGLGLNILNRKYLKNTLHMSTYLTYFDGTEESKKILELESKLKTITDKHKEEEDKQRKEAEARTRVEAKEVELKNKEKDIELQLLDIARSREDLSSQLKMLENIKNDLAKHQDNLAERENELKKIEEQQRARAKSIQDKERKIKVDRESIDIELNKIELLKRNLENDEAIRGLKVKLQSQIDKLQEKILNMENISAYNIAEIVVDVSNIFRLSDTKVEPRDMLKIVPDYTYEMILKTLKNGDSVSVPSEYYAKLYCQKLRYLEFGANDSTYTAIEKIKFNERLDESIICAVEYANDSEMVRITVYREYSLQDISDNDIVHYTIEYGKWRRKMLSTQQ